MDETFAESLVPRRKPYVVLDRQLRPFSFWHHFGLDVIASPFVGHPGEPNLDSLEAASRVCCSVRPQVIAPKRGKWRACWLNYRYGRIESFNRELAEWVAYRQQFAQGPINKQLPDAEPVEAPWYQVVVFQLLQHDPALQKLRERDPARAEQLAWMMPEGEGLWRLAALANARGEKANIMTEAQRRAFQKAGAL